jgi:hypothetical protein
MMHYASWSDSRRAGLSHSKRTPQVGARWYLLGGLGPANNPPRRCQNSGTSHDVPLFKYAPKIFYCLKNTECAKAHLWDIPQSRKNEGRWDIPQCESKVVVGISLTWDIPWVQGIASGISHDVPGIRMWDIPQF